MREKVEEFFELMGGHRLQTVVRPEMGEYQKFAELMGFEKEGVMRQCTHDRKDMILYARIG